MKTFKAMSFFEEAEDVYDEAIKNLTPTQIRAVIGNNESMIAVSPKMQYARRMYEQMESLRGSEQSNTRDHRYGPQDTFGPNGLHRPPSLHE